MTNPTTLVAMKQATHVPIRRSLTVRKQDPGDHTKVRNAYFLPKMKHMPNLF